MRQMVCIQNSAPLLFRLVAARDGAHAGTRDVDCAAHDIRAYFDDRSGDGNGGVRNGNHRTAARQQRDDHTRHRNRRTRPRPFRYIVSSHYGNVIGTVMLMPLGAGGAYTTGGGT